MSTAPQLMAMPEAKELVTREILRWTGLNAQAFSGAANPSSIYQTMVAGHPGVYPYYRELEEKDTAIGSSMQMRRLLILARSRSVNAADAENGQALRYADASTQFLGSIRKFGFAMWELLDAPAYGFGVAEILWGADGGRVWVDKIVGRPQELFRFGKLFYPQTEDLLLAISPGAEGQPVPQVKFLVSTYQPRHGDRRGLPILRRLFWPSWFKRNVLRLHLHFLEKGPGTVAVKYDQTADAQKALEAAEAIANELAVAVPNGFTLMAEALQTTRTRDANDFRSLVDYFDSEMTRVILGQTLTTHGAEQQRGSMALGEIHLEMMYEIIRNDAADLEDVINEQLLGPWLMWTFGPQALDQKFRPYWRIEKDPPKDASGAIDLLTKAHQLVDIPQSAIYEAAQIEPPDPQDAIVQRAALPTSLFSPGQ
jgi:phage gp29-like protein